MPALVSFILLVISLGLASCQQCPPECTSCDNGIANCLGTGIRDIPKTFPSTITVMDLSHNQLTELSSDSFQELPSLQTLRLSGNGISEVMSRSFISLPSLMSIDLSNNPIEMIHDDALEGLKYLRMLSIMATKLRSIGRALKGAPSLHTINMASNEIGEITDENFKSNTQLQMIDLGQNKIRKISPKAFANLNRLRYLNLNSNPIVLLPELQFGSNILQMVDFTNCELQEVPAGMPSSVVDFRLGNNKLSKITVDNFGNITNLRLVTLNNNEITKVEEKAFGHLEHLMEIWLSNNKLKSIPRLLPRSLNKLFLDHNGIYEIGRRNFPINSKLEIISLDTNKVERISEGAWGEMPALKSINLNANTLESLTTGSFSNIPSLECLRLSNNPIKVIEEDAMKDLPKLTEFSASYINSKTTQLPGNFLSFLSSVKKVNMMNSPGLAKSFLQLAKDKNSPALDDVMFISMQYNEIQSLPSNLKQVLPNIEKLFLDGNPFYCDTDLVWFKDWMRSSDVVFYSNEPPVCAAPRKLEGREITSLQNSEFADQRPTTPAPVESVVESEQQAIKTFNVRGSVEAIEKENNDQSADVVEILDSKLVKGNTNVATTKTDNDNDNEDRVKKVKKTKKTKKNKNKKKKKKKKLGRNNKNKKKKKKKSKKGGRIRRHKGSKRRCIVDTNGKKICPRRIKRCKVGPDGKKICKNRRNKQRKPKTTPTTPIVQG